MTTLLALIFLSRKYWLVFPKAESCSWLSVLLQIENNTQNFLTIHWGTKILKTKKLLGQIFISIALLEIQSNSIDSNGIALFFQLYCWSALCPVRKSGDLLQQTLTSVRKQPHEGIATVDTWCSTSSYQLVWTWVLKRTLLYAAAYFINVEYLLFPCVTFVELRTSWSAIMFLHLIWKAISDKFLALYFRVGWTVEKCSMSTSLNSGLGTLLSLRKLRVWIVFFRSNSFALRISKLYG